MQQWLLLLFLGPVLMVSIGVLVLLLAPGAWESEGRIFFCVKVLEFYWGKTNHFFLLPLTPEATLQPSP
jgi:hypothetical protein